MLVFPHWASVSACLLLPACCLAAVPQPAVDLRECLRPSPVHRVAAKSIRIAGGTTLPDGSPILIRITRSTGGVSETRLMAEKGRFTCRYPEDFGEAPALSPCLLYADVIAGADPLTQQAEATFIVTGDTLETKPDLPAAFTDDFLDAKGARDAAAVSWPLHRSLVNRFMRSRGAELAGVGQGAFDLAVPADFDRFKRMLTLYDFDHRDRDWSSPLNQRVARGFWQAEWNRWFGPGNDHPWDGDASNRRPENYRPYTFTNDLADLLILHEMRRRLPRAVQDHRDGLCQEALSNLLALQHRGAESFALPEPGRKPVHYTAGAFRYGLFETGEWLTEGTGWFVNPKSGDHRDGGVFNGRSVWALGESLKAAPAGPRARELKEALALALRFCLHDGLGPGYTKSVGPGLPLWRQAGEHGYLTLGLLAAVRVAPGMAVTLDPGQAPRSLREVTAAALDALVAARNADGHWTKYPDQDAMGLAALAEGAVVLADHPSAAGWKAAAIRVADGWLSAKQDPAERAAPCPHFGRREGSRMTYYVGRETQVHINLYISGLWLHALAKMQALTGEPRYRQRAEGLLAYLCGDNPFHARLLNELGAVFNIIRDTDDANSTLHWDAYPESTAFVQIGLLHWLDATLPKP